MKVHLGCGPNVKPGYMNIDPYVDYQDVYKYDILNLPIEDGQVEEILAEHIFEHIGFSDEEKLFCECYRVLMPDGKLILETPDLEWLCKTFLEAEDTFPSFYQVGAADHYFGNGRATNQRWGIITTHFFGNQNGVGQFHKNGYTEGKLKAIAHLIGFSGCTVTKLMNKGAGCIRATFVK